MRSILLLLIGVGAVFCSDVLDLTDSTFADSIKEHDIVLAEFYAPWCGHCKRLAPEYEKAATKLVANDPPVALAKVDCTTSKETCDKFGVSGFPTLKIFRKGEMSADYDGPREAEGIVKFMRGQVGPSSKELKSLADFDKFTGHDEHAIIGFFKDDSKLKDSFTKVADTERDRYRFAHTTAKDILDKYKYTDDIVVFTPKRFHNKFEEAQIKYDGNFETEKIKKFLSSEMHGLVGHRTRDTMGSFANRPSITVYYNVDYTKDPKGTNYWRNRILKVASEFKRKLNFAISDKDDFTNELDEMGLSDKKSSDKPMVAGYNAAGEKFPMTDDFSIESLTKFAKNLLDGKLEPYMKSEDVPDNSDSAVKIFVAKNFKETIPDDKDALIEYYAPWCGHCKTLAPIYDQLGDAMKGENVVIAKMDATANDVPPVYQVQGFPTIYWKPKGQAPRQYSGGRELKDFVNYISKEATDELTGFDRSGKKKKSKKTEM